MAQEWRNGADMAQIWRSHIVTGVDLPLIGIASQPSKAFATAGIDLGLGIVVIMGRLVRWVL